MATKSKMELIMELKNRLFNNKLKTTKEKLYKSVDAMKSKLKSLKDDTLKAFRAMRAEIPLFGRAMDLLGNPYVMVTAGIVAVTGLFYSATQEAAKFNAEFLNVRQLNLDKSKTELTSYKTLILDSAYQTGKAATDTAKAYYDIQSALGFYGNDAKKVFTEVANYSTATGAELNDSINATTKAIKAFGLQAGDTRMLLESNAKAVQVGITTFKELAVVQTEFAGAAKGAGQSVDVANKIFAGFTSIAKGSAEAATMTKTAFQGLTQEATVKGLKSIGVSIYDSKGQMRDLTKVLTEVDAKFKKMSPKAIDELINKIGGPEGLRALFTKLKTGADDLFATFNAFDASSFNLDEALANAKGDVTVLGNIVKNKFNTVMVKLGEKILPAVAKGLEFTERWLDKLYRNMDKIIYVIKKAIIAFTTFKVTNMLVSSSLGKIALSFGGGLTAGIKSATTAMKGFNAAFKSNMIGLIASLIATLATTLSDLKFESKGFQEYLENRKKMNETQKDYRDATKSGLIQSQLGSLNKRQADDLKMATETRIAQLDDASSDLKRAMKDPIKGGQINRFNQQYKQAVSNLDRKNTPYNKQMVEQTKYKLDEAIRAITGGYNTDDLIGMRKKNEQILSNLKNRNLIDNNKSENTTVNDRETGTQIGGVAEVASQPRSIVINIDAINKGGINTTQTTMANKSPEEIEQWFTEAMMRMLRGIELSY